MTQPEQTKTVISCHHLVPPEHKYLTVREFFLFGILTLFLAACGDSDESNVNTPPLTPTSINAGDITYDVDRLAQGTAGTATPSSSNISSFSGLTFSIKSISTHTGTQVLPTIAEDGTITTTADTSAGSYRVTITPDGSTVLGDPITVDFYVTVTATDADLAAKLRQAIQDYDVTGDFNYLDTSAVTTMLALFTFESVANFNGDISKWDVSAVENFTYMFYGATTFNQDVGGWDVSSGKNFKGMFYRATAFNQDIGKWDVSAGKDFSWMFDTAKVFNQDISGWKVEKGTDFSEMFREATMFNQDLSGWSVTSTADTTDMFKDSGVEKKGDLPLPSWYTP